MAAVDVTIRATLYDLWARTSRPVLIVGEGSLTGLEVGGGPVIPPEPPPNGKPPGIWGPTDPRPTPPIAFPPGWVGGVPPHPIDPPVNPPDDDGFLKPPPPDGGWAYHQTYGWGMYPAPGQPGPKT